MNSETTVQPVVWVNGRLWEPGASTLSPLDHGLTVGDGAFETAKVVDATPFAIRRHHERLQRSLAGLGLPAAELPRLDAGIRAVLSAAPLAFGRLRYTVTAGLGPISSDRHDSDLTYVVAAAPSSPAGQSARLATVPWVRNERSATAGLKTTSYAENVIALRYAHEQGADEAILANSAGRLCEGTGSNIFVVLNGVVFTPPAADGPLLGVTRGLLLEWAAEEGVEIREESVPMSTLQIADEVLITSSIRDVLPVSAIDDRSFELGPVGARLREIFTSRAAQDMDP